MSVCLCIYLLPAAAADAAERSSASPYRATTYQNMPNSLLSRAPPPRSTHERRTLNVAHIKATFPVVFIFCAPDSQSEAQVQLCPAHSLTRRLSRSSSYRARHKCLFTISATALINIIIRLQCVYVSFPLIQNRVYKSD